MGRINKKYSKEFKMSVIKRYKEGNISFNGLAEEFGVASKTQIHVWIKKYEQEGEDAFIYEKRGNPKTIKKVKEEKSISFSSIEEEVRFLRLENEYLKKLCDYLKNSIVWKKYNTYTEFFKYKKLLKYVKII